MGEWIGHGLQAGIAHCLSILIINCATLAWLKISEEVYVKKN